MKNKLPKFLQRALWSYNLKALDKEKDKRLIITQVLNYGNLRDVRWLLNQYSDKEVKEVVADPDRGLWLELVLNFWTKIYNIHLDPVTYEDAIFRPARIKEE